MTALRRVRSVLTAAIALGVLMTVVSTQDRGTTEIVPAADLSAFRAGNIVSDAVFYDSTAMSLSQIQTFLNNSGASCSATGGVPCIKDYATATSTIAGDKYCTEYTGAARETAAEIISKVALACDISPRVLLVTLQKEMGLITSSGPTAKAYTRAMGYGCPDSAGGACSSYYPGLFKQLFYAAKQFRRYAVNPGSYSYEAGMNNKILWHPNSACGSSTVFIENVATASLYNYTPYRPNSAALAAGYGSGNSCSSYGNRNFWNYFTDWFGSTQTGGYDPDAPLGRVDAVTGGPGSIDVRGWVFDPNDKTAALNVHVYVDGRLAGAVHTGTTRGDVAAANPGVGTLQGFEGSVDVEPGVRTACLYAVNVGPGWSNPRLGCATVSVPTTAALNPVGALDVVTTSGTSVTVAGWAFDVDVPTAPVSVHVYVDGRVVSAVTADAVRSDVAAAHPDAGAEHGYSWTGTLTPGSHSVCTFAINQGRGTANPRLGCGTVKVSEPASALGTGSPFGQLEPIKVSGTSVTVGGWAIDPDQPTAPVSVHLYVDGHAAAAVTANRTRTDVGRAYPTAGDAHGYSWTGTLSAGSHQVCTFGINRGAGTGNSRLGCRTVAITGTSPASVTQPPVGTLDRVAASGTTVTASGWTYDLDVPTMPLRVHLYVDGAAVAAVTADRPRADVGRTQPGIGDAHGYSWSGRLAPGTHSLCTYAIDQGGAGGHARLGCRSVTVG
ncbi:MAG: hypothetical protein JWQ45_1979 [Blastococcus sp.]|nr:hypothetical protein [Blastococcus sp.]